MTEEDTFNALRRISHEEMRNHWFESPLEVPADWGFGKPVGDDVEKLFSKYGWTFYNWLHAREEYYGFEKYRI